MAKPSSYPEWAINYLEELRSINGVERLVANRKEPFQEWKNTGELYNQNIPREYLNWQLYTIGEWIKHLDSSISPADTPVTEDGELSVGGYTLVDSSGGLVTLDIPAALTFGDRFIVANYGGNCIIDGAANTIDIKEADGSTDVAGDTITLTNGEAVELVAISATAVKKVLFGQLGTAAYENVSKFLVTDEHSQMMGGFNAGDNVDVLTLVPDDFGSVGNARLRITKLGAPNTYEIGIEDVAFTEGALSFSASVYIGGNPVWHTGNAASTSDLWGNSSTFGITPAAVYAANAPVTSSGSGAFALDFKAGRKFTRTLTGNSTMSNPTNQEIGQEGLIFIEQDGSGGHTLALGSDFKVIGGTATVDTTAGVINVFAYYVKAANQIILSYSGVAA